MVGIFLLDVLLVTVNKYEIFSLMETQICLSAGFHYAAGLSEKMGLRWVDGR